jgi:SOS-response transcriptional repressor LexA
MLDTRPSKKQQELFEFIRDFINQQGYGPSYREVMRALGYKSVSTVATHIDGLIARGMLHKKDNSARSLEVVKSDPSKPQENDHVKWLKREIKKRSDKTDEMSRKETIVLSSALEILLDQTTD